VAYLLEEISGRIPLEKIDSALRGCFFLNIVTSLRDESMRDHLVNKCDLVLGQQLGLLLEDSLCIVVKPVVEGNDHLLVLNRWGSRSISRA
jgi:hypothetical protein